MSRVVLFLACLSLLLASPAAAQSGANVLLVVNESSADSGRIAEHYARVRSEPHVQRTPGRVDDREVDRQDDLLLRLAAVARGRPDS